MAPLPKHIDSPTVRAIYASREKAQEAELRPYLGASLIGGECDRALWYAFRWAMNIEHEGRMVRLLETGDLAEPRFADDLRRIGCQVHTHNEAGEQFGFRAVGGHFSGHMDAAILGLPEAPKTWHVGEFKTHNDRSFHELQRKGVKSAKFRHYVQMQVYMHFMGIDRALYLAENKNTSELYSERVELDKGFAEMYVDRARFVIGAATPPDRAGADVDAFVCKFCDYKPVCWGESVPLVTCRSCLHSTPIVDDSTEAKWTCAKRGGAGLAIADQRAGCADHLFVPLTINFARQVDAGADPAGDWVEYESADGSRWRNSKRPNDYASAELAKLPAAMVGAGTVDAIKEIVGGVVLSVEPLTPEERTAELDKWIVEQVKKSTESRVNVPKLFEAGEKQWAQADDCAPWDVEQLAAAFKRLAGRDYVEAERVGEFKGDDFTIHVFSGGWMVKTSKAQGDEIRRVRL